MTSGMLPIPAAIAVVAEVVPAAAGQKIAASGPPSSKFRSDQF